MESNAQPSKEDKRYLDVSKEGLIHLRKGEAIEMLVRARMHDLSNELMVIGSSAEMAALTEDPKQAKVYLDHILRSVDRAGLLMSSTARFVRPRVADHFRPTQFYEIVEDAFRITRDIASGQIRWERTGETTEGIVLGARDHLLQAILCLLNNAVQAISEHPGKIHLHLENTGFEIRLLIGNSGEPEQTELDDRVFDPFVSFGKFKAGLGLTTARSIAETHGGGLNLLPSPGGAVKLPVVFDFRLPLMADHNQLRP